MILSALIAQRGSTIDPNPANAHILMIGGVSLTINGIFLSIVNA